jgi:MFS family permease
VKYHLGFNESDGALMLGYFALAFMLNAVFAGMIGSKYKRNTTIKVGLLGLILVTASCFFVTSQLALSVLIFIAGWFWALVNVNSLPMVVDMTTPEQVGGYTGLYYFFSQVGTLMAPLLAGALMDWLGYRTLMPLTSFFAVLALICMFFVKRGEAVK